MNELIKIQVLESRKRQINRSLHAYRKEKKALLKELEQIDKEDFERFNRPLREIIRKID